MTSNPHLIARLSFVDRFVVGSPPIGSDFRAECDFGLAEMRSMVRVELEVPSPTPHEATARIWLLCPERQAGRLSEETARRMWLYRMDRPTEPARMLARIICEQARAIVEAIPRTASGKVLKHVLRDQARAEMGG